MGNDPRRIAVLPVIAVALAAACGPASRPPGQGISLREAVDLTVEEVVGADTLDRTLLAYPEPLEAGDSVRPRMMEGAGAYHVENTSWLLFLDDMSSYRWAHGCRYVLVDAAGGEMRVIRESWWPARRDLMDTVRVWR